MYESGKKLKKKSENEEKWKKKPTGRHIFRGLKFPDSKRKKMMEEDSSKTDDDEGGGRKRQLLSSRNLTRLSRIEEEIPGPSTHKHSLRKRYSRHFFLNP